VDAHRPYGATATIRTQDLPIYSGRMSFDEIRAHDRRAVARSVELVDTVTAADLARPTPCGDWTLADLLGHLTAQHRGFAAAARGDGADLGHWALPPDGTNPVAAYRVAAEDVVAAFAAVADPEAPFTLPEITTRMTFPASQAIGFHLIDYVVHSWDLARSLGVPADLDDDLVRAALPIALAVPNGPERLRPGASFAPALQPRPGSSTLDEILVRLGRSPDWPRVD
jgi:uncharacterized protein (TIGR03086 family)